MHRSLLADKFDQTVFHWRHFRIILLILELLAHRRYDHFLLFDYTTDAVGHPLSDPPADALVVVEVQAL